MAMQRKERKLRRKKFYEDGHWPAVAALVLRGWKVLPQTNTLASLSLRLETKKKVLNNDTW